MKCLPLLAAISLAAPSLAHALTAAELTGRWGLAAYFDARDAAQTETAAGAQCHAPYTIAAGPKGGVMLHLPDAPKASEMLVKTSLGTTWIGPAGEAGGANDREVLRFDGRSLTLKWVDASVGRRYGIMVFVRCGK